MDVEVRIQGSDLAHVVRRYAARRMRFALGRFSSRVRRIVVRISDVNGTLDRGCHFEVVYWSNHAEHSSIPWVPFGGRVESLASLREIVLEVGQAAKQED